MVELNVEFSKLLNEMGTLQTDMQKVLQAST